MSGNSREKRGANAQKKKNFWRPIQESIDAKQASIDSCYARKEEKRKLPAKLLQELEKLRIQRLRNFNKRMVVVFAKLDDQIVILTIVDPSLITCTYTTGKNNHIVYGNTKYPTLSMMASYNSKGKRSERDGESYTVSTLDGINFQVIDKNEKVFSFKSSIKYETLAGKTFSNVQFDQELYSPSNLKSDEKTQMIHAELVRLIEEDEEYLKINPDLVGYIPYHWSEFV